EEDRDGGTGVRRGAEIKRVVTRRAGRDADVRADRGRRPVDDNLQQVKVVHETLRRIVLVARQVEAVKRDAVPRIGGERNTHHQVVRLAANLVHLIDLIQNVRQISE